METVLGVLTWVSVLGCGLMAGVFFAFSTFVMSGLTRLPAAKGIAAMQAINVSAVSGLFIAAFIGTALACAGLVLSSLGTWSEPTSRERILGGAIYLFGCFAVTAAFNVPRNDALATLNPDSADAALAWARYVSGWTAWNHVRTVACLAATVLLTRALR
uniref:Integral membrane protein n=1 Tax=Myxococcus fulvus TaxID=33 RepID=A0A3S7UW61_MYXFU|nr:integral membrane protein [Myxococcus fulvus]